MNKRLRKKKHVGEFQEFGFKVHGMMQAGTSAADQDAFLDRWIDFVEARELCFGGGSAKDSFEGFVALSYPGSATAEDRAAAEAHLKADTRVASFTVGPLVDAWR